MYVCCNLGRYRLRLRQLLLPLVVSLVAASAGAQAAKPDSKCKDGSKRAECKTTPAQPQDAGAASAGSAFPFPTEDSKRGGEAPATPAPNPQNSLPAMPTDAVPDPPPSSERPMHLPPDSGGSSTSDDSSTSSSSSRTAEDDDVAPTSAPSSAPIKSSALKDLGSRADSSEARLKLEQTRVADDLKVGGFYLKDGNLQGAYLRFKDASDHAPEDPDVRFNLAEVSSRLNKREEAALNYREYLRLDPGGDHDKTSRKALAKLGAAP